MLAVLILGACFVVYGTSAKKPESSNDVKLPCHFGDYDLDGNGEISAKEFLFVAEGKTKMDAMTLFARLDTNGDGKIVKEENQIGDRDPDLFHSGIFDHCRHLRCCLLCLFCAW